MINKKLVIKVILNSLLGLVLVYIWSRFVNIHELVSILKTTDLTLASAFFIFFIASWAIRGIRLKVLLLSSNLPTKDLIYLSFLGQFLSFLIPLRAGEVAKSIYLYTQFKIPLAKSVVWVLIDRFLDLWTNLALVGILILITQTHISNNFSNILFLIFSGFSLLCLVVVSKPHFGKALARRLPFYNLTHSIIDGFSILDRSPTELIILLLLSIAALISDALAWFVTFQALDIKLPFVSTLLGSLLSALTFLIPAAPGYVGSTQISTLAVFSGILSMPVSLSSAAAVLYHVLVAIALLISGIISLHLLRFDLNLVWKKLKKQ